MTQIAAQNKEFMNVGGDLYWKVADFPEADILAERWRRIIPPNILDDNAIDPKIEEAMNQASAKIDQLSGMVGKLTQDLANRDKEFDLKAGELRLREKEAEVRENREDYKAETLRVTALGNAGPGISVEQIQPVLKELLAGLSRNGELIYNEKGPHEGGMTTDDLNQDKEEEDSLPDVPGSRLAPDGNHYVKQGDQYHRVEMNG
jgi:hypothetical protein